VIYISGRARQRPDRV